MTEASEVPPPTNCDADSFIQTAKLVLRFNESAARDYTLRSLLAKMREDAKSSNKDATAVATSGYYITFEYTDSPYREATAYVEPHIFFDRKGKIKC